MASRFYLPSSGTVTISAADLTGWDETDGQSPNETDVVKKNTNIQLGPLLSYATFGYKQLSRQFISKPIAAQTISGTIKGQIQCAAVSAKNNMINVIRVIVVSNDGQTLRGTLLTIGNYVLTPLLTIYYNRKLAASGQAISSVTAQDGDRIVFQIGFTNAQNDDDTKLKTAFRYGDNSDTDLPEDETDSTMTKNPWIEFSADIAFQSKGNFFQMLG